MLLVSLGNNKVLVEDKVKSEKLETTRDGAIVDCKVVLGNKFEGFAESKETDAEVKTSLNAVFKDVNDVLVGSVELGRCVE